MTFYDADDARDAAAEDEASEAALHDAQRRLEKARRAALRPADGQRGEWALVDLDNAEKAVTALLAPATEAQAEQRRRERDRADALVLKTILAQYHSNDTGMVYLTESDRRVIASVAHRLLKGWVEP